MHFLLQKWRLLEDGEIIMLTLWWLCTGLELPQSCAKPSLNDTFCADMCCSYNSALLKPVRFLDTHAWPIYHWHDYLRHTYMIAEHVNYPLTLIIVLFVPDWEHQCLSDVPVQHWGECGGPQCQGWVEFKCSTVEPSLNTVWSIMYKLLTIYTP